jgi:type VI secretion system protein VasG
MMDVDIKGLIRKLNGYCTKSLEAAAGLCISRGHYEVGPEHLLLQMVEDPQADLQQILRHFGINPALLLATLQRNLEQLRSGNSGRPVFSPLLLEWIQDAWVLASVEYQDTQVRSGMLLLALIFRPDRYTADDLSRPLEGIKRDELRGDLYRITTGSREAEAPATEGGKPPAGRAGRPVEETAIGRFMIDFTDRARAGEIDPVFGRDREIRQMIDILARRRKNNPIVVGEPGVGKTAVVEGLALRIVSGDVPDVLKNVRLLSLDLGLLQAGAGMRGEFENRLKAVITEVKASPTPIVTFIDEAHTLIGAGGTAGGSDAANLLKPALARGELRTIAATTWSEYKKYFEKDAALERRFQVVKLDEPSEEAAIGMMRGLRDKYEAAHKVRILEEGVEAAARLSSRYISGRQLPDKAVDLLDTAAARVKIGQATIPESVDDFDRKLQALERERSALLREKVVRGEAVTPRILEIEEEAKSLTEQRAELAGRWEKEKAVVEKVKALRARLEGSPAAGNGNPLGGSPSAPTSGATLTGSENPGTGLLTPEEETTVKAELTEAMAELRGIQGPIPLVPLDVDARLIASVVSSWTGIPVGKMVSDEAALILTFKQRMAERIKGQDQALEAVDKGIRAARAGMKNPKTPIGVFLFVGPSGVGKTETALVVADLMFGGERFVTTINMSEFQEKHTVSRLVGSPPGYVGYGEGGVLTEAVRQRPYSVVLLDEVEKADPEVMNIFYQVFDKGMLADGEGRIIDFKNTVLFLTSNLATDVIMQLCSGPVPPTGDEVVSAIRPILSKHFKPALLGRMQVVPFFPLAPEFLQQIVRLKLRQIENRLQDSHRMRMTIDPSVEETIARRCTDVDAGARNIDHIIQQTLLPMLSTALLERMAEAALPSSVRIGIGSDESFTLDFGAPPEVSR